MAVSPCPGKCLAVDSTPASSNPATWPTTASPTMPGNAPGDRIPMTGLLGRTLTSATGAKSMLTPPADSHLPVRSATSRAAAFPRSLSPATAAPSTIAPGSVTGIRMRRTRVPFSWSAPISSGGSPIRRACPWAALTTRRHCAAVPGAMMIRPPGLVARTTERAAAGSSESIDGMISCRTRCLGVSARYASATRSDAGLGAGSAAWAAGSLEVPEPQAVRAAAVRQTSRERTPPQ